MDAARELRHALESLAGNVLCKFFLHPLTCYY